MLLNGDLLKPDSGLDYDTPSSIVEDNIIAVSTRFHYVSHETYVARGRGDDFIVELIETLYAIIRHDERNDKDIKIWPDDGVSYPIK